MRKNFNKANLVIIIVSLLFFSSCLYKENPEKAKEIVNNFYTALKNDDFKKAINYYSEDIIKNSEEETLIEKYSSKYKEFGKIKFYDINLYGHQNIFGTSNGIIYLFSCHVEYSNKKTKERISLFSPFYKKDMKIIDHIIKFNN